MEKRVQDYSKEILKIIRSNTSPAVMAAKLQDYHENDLADVMPELTVQERYKLYRILDTDMLSDIFEYTEEENAAEYLNEMDVKKAAAILSRMETDALADVLNKFEKTKKKILIDLLENLVVTSYPYVYAEESIDDCIEELKDYSEDSIPVLDNDNQLLGVITSASIIDLVDDEMGDDYAKLAGLTAEEDLKEPLKESMKKRMPWLIILLGLGMVVSSVVGVFEKVVTALPIIMCFQSLILDMAGNVGTQSLAVTIRVLMDESLTGKQKLELVWKEMRIGLCNGSLLGFLSFILIGLYIYLFKGKTLLFSYAVSGCIGAALLLAMLISSAVGTCIPLFFKKINIDPAVASGPLITTINDLVAVITYYGLSWLFLLEILQLAG